MFHTKGLFWKTNTLLTSFVVQLIRFHFDCAMIVEDAEHLFVAKLFEMPFFTVIPLPESSLLTTYFTP